MKSLERRYNNIRELQRNTNLSSYSCFAEAVMDQRFSKNTISRYFYKLVEKGDYDKNGQESIVRHLYNFSNPREDGTVEQK